MEFLDRVTQAVDENNLPKPIGDTLHHFYHSYKTAIDEAGDHVENYHPLLLRFLDFVLDQLESPFSFEPYHQGIQKPFDYFHFGLDFIRPLVRMEQSEVHHLEFVDRIVDQLNQNDNVILLANHQTEPDPQAISLMLEETHPEFAQNMIFVAGHRVTSDPLTVPFSKGCNLLCIYSKKHIENPPEKKEEKLRHNRKTMKRMSELLAEGGKCIYVAPSGGRDRPNDKGVVDVASFDPQSIEMFHLMSKQSGHPTHFYPLALATYNLLPPPNSVLKDLGEHRHAQCTPIHLAFGEEIDMENFPGSEEKDRRARRENRAKYIWSLVKELYQKISVES